MNRLQCCFFSITALFSVSATYHGIMQQTDQLIVFTLASFIAAVFTKAA